MTANLLPFVQAVPRRHRRRLLLEFCEKQNIKIPGLKNPTELELFAYIEASLGAGSLELALFIECCIQDAAEGRL